MMTEGVLVTEQTEKPNPPRVRMTPRDRAALEWLSQMYGAPVDLVAKLLGATQRRTYALVKRWSNAGWVRTGQVDAGVMWVWPKRSIAASYLDWDPGDWVPRPSQAAHLRATAITRLALAPALAEWTPERQLRHEAPPNIRGKEQPYLPDGVWHSSQGDLYIEVELTPKGHDRTYKVIRRAMAAATQAGAAAVLYITANNAVKSQVTTAAEMVRREHTNLTARFQTMPLAQVASKIDIAPTRDHFPTEEEEDHG